MYDEDRTHINYLHERAKEQEEEAKKLEDKLEHKRIAEAFMMIFDAFTEVGFSDERAWWFVTEYAKHSLGA